LGVGAARYLLLRIARAALTAFAVVTLVFLLIRAVPGDPVDAILGDQASPADRAEVRKLLGLDEPLLTQYAQFLGSIVNGTLGYSFRAPDRSVRTLIAEVFPPTLELSLSAFAVAWLLAIPLGVLAAARRGSGIDRAASVFALAGLAMPTIWLGPLLVLAFAVKLRLLPLPGDSHQGFLSLILPSLTIGTALAAALTRQTRAAMIEVLSQPYIAAARARGVPRLRVFFQHALRNAMMPVLTVGAAQLGALLSGAVIAEKIFERPGLGSLFLEAFFARDIPVVQGVVLVVGLVYVAVNVALDLTYALVDPRVRLA
jgi:peptide/nickel transport system permease protein